MESQKQNLNQKKFVFNYLASPVALTKILSYNNKKSTLATAQEHGQQIRASSNSGLGRLHWNKLSKSCSKFELQDKHQQSKNNYSVNHFSQERGRYVKLKRQLQNKFDLINQKLSDQINPTIIEIYKQNILELFFQDFLKELNRECRQKGQILQFIWGRTFSLLQTMVDNITKTNLKKQKEQLKESIQSHTSYQKLLYDSKQRQQNFINQLKYNRIFIDSLIHNIRYKRKQIRQLKVNSKILVNQLNDFRSVCVDLKSQNIGMLMSWTGTTEENAKKMQATREILFKQTNNKFKLINNKMNADENYSKVKQKWFEQNQANISNDKNKLYAQIESAIMEASYKGFKSYCSIIDDKIDQYQILYEQNKKENEENIESILGVALARSKYVDVASDTYGLRNRMNQNKHQQTNASEKYQLQIIKNQVVQTQLFQPKKVQNNDAYAQTNFVGNSKNAKKEFFQHHQYSINIFQGKENKKTPFQKNKKPKISINLNRLGAVTATATATPKKSRFARNKSVLPKQSISPDRKLQKNRQMSLHENDNLQKGKLEVQTFQRNRLSSFNQPKMKGNLHRKSKALLPNKFQTKASEKAPIDQFQILKTINEYQPTQFPSIEKMDSLKEVMLKKQSSFNSLKTRLSKFSQLSKKSNRFEDQSQSDECKPLDSIKSYVSLDEDKVVEQQKEIKMRDKERAVKILRRFSNIRQSLIIDHTIDQYFKQIENINKEEEIQVIKVKEKWQEIDFQLDLMKLIGSLAKTRKGTNLNGLIKVLSITYSWAIQSLGKGSVIRTMSQPLTQYLQLMYGSVKGINLQSRMLSFLANCHMQRQESSLIRQFIANTNIDYSSVNSNSNFEVKFQKRSSFQIQLHLRILEKISVNYAPLMNIEDLYTSQNKVKMSLKDFLQQNGLSNKVSEQIYVIIESKITDAMEYKRKDQKNTLKRSHQGQSVQYLDIFKCSNLIISSLIAIRNRYTQGYKLFHEIYQKSYKNMGQKNQCEGLSLNLIKFLINCHPFPKIQAMKQFKLLIRIQNHERNEKIANYGQFLLKSSLYQLHQLVNYLEQQFFKITKTKIHQLSLWYLESVENLPQDIRQQEQTEYNILKTLEHRSIKKTDVDKNSEGQMQNIKSSILLKIAENRVTQFFQDIIGENMNFFHGAIVCTLADLQYDK